MCLASFSYQSCVFLSSFVFPRQAVVGASQGPVESAGPGWGEESPPFSVHLMSLRKECFCLPVTVERSVSIKHFLTGCVYWVPVHISLCKMP